MKREISIEKAIDEYLLYAKKSCKFTFHQVEQLLLYFNILKQYNADTGSSDLSKKHDREILRENARLIIMCSKKEHRQLKEIKKADRAKFFNGFVEYVSDSSVFSIGRVKLEKINPVLSDLERKLDIIKNFRQYQKYTQPQLGDIYYVDERTIRNDLREIREGCLDAFGQNINLEYNVENKELYSTPVPLFLMQNITQIVAMLNGLGALRRDERYRVYAEASAIVIWKQLTLNVRDRIFNELIELLHLDEEWYEWLNENREEFELKYYTERMLDDSRMNILRFFKNGETCNVYYFEDNKTECLREVRVSDCLEHGFRLSGSEKFIKYENLIDIQESGN